MREVALNVIKIGVICVRIFNFMLLNFEAQPQVGNILSEKMCSVYPKMYLTLQRPVNLIYTTCALHQLSLKLD